jgi:hypothetical protein
LVNNLEKKLKPIIDEQQRVHKRHIAYYEEKELVSQYIDSSVNNIQTNIELYFRYGNTRNDNIKTMDYFVNTHTLNEYSYKNKQADQFQRSKYIEHLEHIEAFHSSGHALVDH